MDYSVYELFDLAQDASPHEILSKCKEYCHQWNSKSVDQVLTQSHGRETAIVNSDRVHEYGKAYLNSAAAVLLDPSAKQCYDAWLDARRSPSPEKIKLTRSMLLWYNQTTSKEVRFGESMINALGQVSQKRAATPKRTCVSVRPKCRCCRSDFDFSEGYLVLHCHCTTRVGHVGCLNDFSTRMKHKCPVCRQQLLKRHQVSKYLFWNVKDKYKFIA